jgi:predicted TIM-barrel fold metal-dependent hydrolase
MMSLITAIVGRFGVGARLVSCRIPRSRFDQPWSRLDVSDDARDHCQNCATEVRGEPMRRTILAALLSCCGVATGADRIFDLHVHLHDGEASIRKYEQQLAENKLSVAGFGAMWFGGPNQALADKVAQTRAHNDALLALADKHPGMLPIATVHPYDGQAALDELRRVAGRGVKVLKIHPHTQQFDASDPRVLTLVKLAGELNVVVLMDNASIVPDDCEHLFNLALASPKTKFIFAHLGGFNFRFWNILPLARTAEGLFADNIYFDISGIPVIIAGSPIQEEYVWTIRNVGVDHVLFGSDFPQLTLPQNLAALDRLGLTEAEKSKIRFENASKLLGIK